LPEDEQRRYEASEMRLLYVAMTRARDRLYLEYRYPLPKELERFVDYVKYVD
jgi:ATP-dependent exoDNAse (exonuclease V) beta subunit